MNLAEGDDVADLLLISFSTITALMMGLTRLESWMSRPHEETDRSRGNPESGDGSP